MKYHFTPNKGWMNDPNGLIYYKGRYHMFFQHNPHDIVWGPMHWGHASSEDLINWEEHEIALYPDLDYENDGGCFSGSAIAKDGKMYLIYTSVSKEYGQAQSIAWSEDGINFVKCENNPVIKHFPEDATADFRDPKVFEYNGEYRMIVGTKFDNHGRIVQYKSKNLINWEYIGILFDDFEYDNVIECPDLFLVDNYWVLMYSMIGKSNCRELFIIGDFDGTSFIEKKRCLPEFGPQFYAAQSFSANGKRIVIGWLFDWDIKVDKNAKSAGAMTIPREVHVVDDQVILYPVEGIMNVVDITRSNELADKPVTDEMVDITANKASNDKMFQDNLKYVYDNTKDIEVESMDVLIDEEAIEVFVNKGKINFTFNNCNRGE